MIGLKKIKELKRLERVLPFLTFIPFFTISCSNDMKDVSRFARQNPPDQEIKDARILRSEYGKLQLKLTAPVIKQYRTPDTRTLYPDGVELGFYAEDRSLKTFIRANKAISYDDKNILKANDSVVVIDYSNGDTVYLEDIIWKSNEDIIYSNHPVRAVNGNRVTYGDGFVSDENMNNLRIRRQRGVIEFQD